MVVLFDGPEADAGGVVVVLPVVPVAVGGVFVAGTVIDLGNCVVLGDVVIVQGTVLPAV